MDFITRQEANNLLKKYRAKEDQIRETFLQDIDTRIRLAVRKKETCIYLYQDLNDAEIKFLETKGYSFKGNRNTIYFY